jgi:hypothetical protein
MTTDNAEDRFTTRQALSFCQFIQNSLTSKELEEKLSPLLDLSSGENVQRGLWDLLPADFVTKWTVGGLGWVRTNFDNFSICCQLTRKARLKQVNTRQHNWGTIESLPGLLHAESDDTAKRTVTSNGGSLVPTQCLDLFP